GFADNICQTRFPTVCQSAKSHPWLIHATGAENSGLRAAGPSGRRADDVRLLGSRLRRRCALRGQAAPPNLAGPSHRDQAASARGSCRIGGTASTLSFFAPFTPDPPPLFPAHRLASPPLPS